MSAATLRRVKRASDAERRAVERLADARQRLNDELRAAAAEGVSVRELAETTERAKSHVHRVIVR